MKPNLFVCLGGPNTAFQISFPFIEKTRFKEVFHTRKRLLTKPSLCFSSRFFSQKSGFQQFASATVKTANTFLIMILLGQNHLLEKNMSKVPNFSLAVPWELQFIQEDYELSALIYYSASFNSLKQMSLEFIQGTDLTLT